MAKRPCNAREECFAREYVVCNDFTEAYRRTGYTGLNAGKLGPRMAARPHVAALIAELQAKLGKKAEVKAERIIQESDTCGLVDPLGYVNPTTGEPLPLHLVPEAARRALVGFTITETTSKDGDVVRRYTYKLDKVAALGLSAKCRGMGKDTVDVHLTIEEVLSSMGEKC